MEKEFAYGYLKTEGIIQPEEIESVMLDGAEIGVLTANPFKVLLPKKTVVSGCGGTATYLDAAKLPVLEETIRRCRKAWILQSFAPEDLRPR